MRERKVYFLVVLNLFFFGEIFSQDFTIGVGVESISKLHSTKLLQVKTQQVCNAFLKSNPERSTVAALIIKKLPGCTKDLQNPLFIGGSAFGQPLPDDLYFRHLGLFCKQEIKVEKMLKVPVKLRLGSLNYVNYLEGK